MHNGINNMLLSSDSIKYINFILSNTSVEDDEIRVHSLETLQEQWLLSLVNLFWTQLGWIWAYLASGWIWIFVVQLVDFLLYNLRCRVRLQGPDSDQMAGRPVLAVHCALQMLFASLVIFVLNVSPTDLTTVYGMLLTIGFLGYTAALCAAFPRLGMLNLAVLTAACSVGLALGPSHEMRIFIPLVAGAGGAFVLMLFHNHENLMTSLRAQQANRMVALHDPLTKLPNRLRLQETLTAVVSSLGLPGGVHSLAVLCLDLDGFKEINDENGHAAGDWVLVHAAGILKANVAGSDLVARIGGDEFVILLRDADEDRVREVANSILREIERPFDIRCLVSLRIGVSIGAVLAVERGEKFESLLDIADKALYQAKRSGRGRLVIADSTAIATPLN